MTGSEMIYARKGTLKTYFTALIWRGMGKNKNGWEQITKEEYDSKAATGSPASKPAAVVDETKYRQLYEQGKGLEQDGKLAEALAKFQEAEKIKSSSSLKGKINKLTQTLAAEQGRNELIGFADAALAEQDYEGAIAAYKEAQELRTSEDVTKKIAEAEQAQAAALVK